MHRTGTETREPRDVIRKRLFLAQVLNHKYEVQLERAEQQLDAILTELADAVRTIADLEQRLARYEAIDATCEALGM